MGKISLVNPQVLIYQMGKVASKSIEESLKKYTSFENIIHVHHLSYNELDRIEKWYNEELNVSTPDYIKWSRKLRDTIEEYKNKVHFKIITLYRDPIDVEISAIFQNLEVGHRDCLNTDGQINLKKLLNKVENIFNNYNINKNYYINWYDNELKDVFDFDIYNIDKKILSKNGYYIHINRNIEILVMNFHRLQEIFQDAMHEFLKIDNIELYQSNISSDKNYSKEYEEFKSLMHITEESRKKIYSTKYAKLFFNEP